MIEVYLVSDTYTFHNKKSALRFMYMMKNKGFMITGWKCEDPCDNDWLNRRFNYDYTNH